MHTYVAFWVELLAQRGATHPDLAELHLDLLRDHVGPVLLSQEVPEHSPQQSVHPRLRLHALPLTPWKLMEEKHKCTI